MTTLRTHKPVSVTKFKGGMGALTIDYLSIPLKDCLVKCEVIKDSDLNTSDHYAVNAILNIQCLPGSRNTYRVDGRIKWTMP